MSKVGRIIYIRKPLESQKLEKYKSWHIWKPVYKLILPDILTKRINQTPNPKDQKMLNICGNVLTILGSSMLNINNIDRYIYMFKDMKHIICITLWCMCVVCSDLFICFYKYNMSLSGSGLTERDYY